MPLGIRIVSGNSVPAHTSHLVLSCVSQGTGGRVSISAEPLKISKYLNKQDDLARGESTGLRRAVFLSLGFGVCAGHIPTYPSASHPTLIYRNYTTGMDTHKEGVWLQVSKQVTVWPSGPYAQPQPNTCRKQTGYTHSPSFSANDRLGYAAKARCVHTHTHIHTHAHASGPTKAHTPKTLHTAH